MAYDELIEVPLRVRPFEEVYDHCKVVKVSQRLCIEKSSDMSEGGAEGQIARVLMGVWEVRGGEMLEKAYSIGHGRVKIESVIVGIDTSINGLGGRVE